MKYSQDCRFINVNVAKHICQDSYELKLYIIVQENKTYSIYPARNIFDISSSKDRDPSPLA